MKVGTVQYCVVDRTCHELFDTEWITKVHGKWSQRSACVCDRFRVLGSTARQERAQLSHIRSPSGIAKRKSPSDGSRRNWTIWENSLPEQKEPYDGYNTRIKGCTFLILLSFVLIIIPVIPLMTKTVYVLLPNLLLIYNAWITHNREKQKNKLVNNIGLATKQYLAILSQRHQTIN